jgi:hypothetical protein
LEAVFIGFCAVLLLTLDDKTIIIENRGTNV